MEWRSYTFKFYLILTFSKDQSFLYFHCLVEVLKWNHFSRFFKVQNFQNQNLSHTLSISLFFPFSIPSIRDRWFPNLRVPWERGPPKTDASASSTYLPPMTRFSKETLSITIQVIFIFLIWVQKTPILLNYLLVVCIEIQDQVKRVQIFHFRKSSERGFIVHPELEEFRRRRHQSPAVGARASLQWRVRKRKT